MLVKYTVSEFLSAKGSFSSIDVHFFLEYIINHKNSNFPSLYLPETIGMTDLCYGLVFMAIGEQINGSKTHFVMATS